VPVTVEFPSDAAGYHVEDPMTGAVLPSYADGFDLHFVARGLPGVGYTKYRLEPRTADASGAAPSDLHLDGTTIENTFFRLTVDPATGHLTSAVHKATGRELVRADAALPFGAPIRAVFGDPAFAVLPGGARVAVVDERPARLRLAVERPGAVVSRVTYTLWENLDRVDVEADVDLEALGPTELAEEYGLAFPFDAEAPEAHLGVLGGFIGPDRDRAAIPPHDAFALRQSLALTDADGTVSWAASDSRVARPRTVAGEAEPTVVAVLANHFPPEWNRNEENEGVWPLRFAFTHRPGTFDGAFTDTFGRDLAQPVAAYPTWLTAAEPVRSFLTLDGDPVHLLSFQPGEDGAVVVRLRNPDPAAEAAVRVALPRRALRAAERVTFVGEDAEPLVIDGGGVFVRLQPNGITTLRLHPVRPQP
jgi:hypothetical protein